MQDYIKSFEKQEEILTASNCLSSGICTVDPTLGALEELLLNEIKQISYYLVRAREFGFENKKIAAAAVKALTITLVNTNFNEREYLKVFENLVENKKEAKKSYLHMCKNNPMGCEVVNFPPETHFSKKDNIGKLIKEGQKYLTLRAKGISAEKNGLLKLIVLITKTSAENIQRIKSFEPNFTDFDFEILRIFSLKNFPSTRIDKLKRRILEFAAVSMNIRQKLSTILTEHYGEKTSAKVRLSAKAGKSILVSGTSLRELEKLLIATEKEDINVYTHNSLLIAHAYPKLRKYKNLIGHWCSENMFHDFANFKGVIYLTKNSNQKVDSLYRGLIYSSEEINSRGVGKLINGNYEPLITATLNHEGFEEDEPEEFASFEYNKKNIEKILETEKEFTVFVGNSKGVDFSQLTSKKVVVNLQYPIEADLMYKIIEKAQESKIDVTFFFARCERTVVNLLLSLIQSGIKEIYLSKCPIASVSPYILDTLSANFGIKVVE